jgi:hypothetical protein
VRADVLLQIQKALLPQERKMPKDRWKRFPLFGTLYGEMPQPPKTAVFRIPKKVRARRSPTPPRRQRSPTPPRRRRSPTPPSSTSADFEDDDEPSLRYDSSEEETENGKVESKIGKKVDKIESPAIEDEESKKSSKKSEDESSLCALKVAEMVKAALLSMGIKPVEKTDSRPDSRNDEEKALMNPNDIAAMVKSLVQNELSKHVISPSKNEQEVSSTNEADNDFIKPKSKDLDQKIKEAVDVPSDVETSEDDSKTPKPSTSNSSLEDKVMEAVEKEVRKQKGHKKTELDKLHEDIRESFIKDGVMKAVGTRTRNPHRRSSYNFGGELGLQRVHASGTKRYEYSIVALSFGNARHPGRSSVPPESFDRRHTPTCGRPRDALRGRREKP